VLVLRHFAFLSFCVVLRAQVGAPQNLHAVSATSREVKIAWTAVAGASGYTVERKVLGATTPFAPLDPKPITTAETSDSTIAAMTTYVYRVKTGATVSKELTVGPPPIGFSTMVATPANLKEGEEKSQFAMRPQMTLDSNGDPAAIYYFLKRNGDDVSESAISFVSWNRALYRWNAPVEVMKVGEVGKPAPITFARDAATNAYAIISETTNNHSLLFALSTDNGLTWKTRPAVTFDENTVRCPSLALAKGAIYLAYAQSDSPMQYATGKETDDPSTWTKSPIPAPKGDLVRFSVSLDSDSAGNPAVAFMNADGYNTTVFFWRPGQSAPVRVTDSNNFQNDEPLVKLVFDGTKPRIGLLMGRTETRFSANEWNYLAVSSDDGKTWPAPVYLPNDETLSMGNPMPAFNLRGEGAVMLDLTGGSGGKCDQPKLSRSSDLIHWKTCSPNSTVKPKLSFAGSGQIRFAENGKLYSVMSYPRQDLKDDGRAPEGLVLWREP